MAAHVRYKEIGLTICFVKNIKRISIIKKIAQISNVI